jgi:hypothetical protein
MDAILPEADDIIVKPFETGKLADLVRERMLIRKSAIRTPKERVAAMDSLLTQAMDSYMTVVLKPVAA